MDARWAPSHLLVLDELLDAADVHIGPLFCGLRALRHHGVEQGLAVRDLQLVEPPAAKVLLGPVSGEQLGEHEVAELGPVDTVVAGCCFACYRVERQTLLLRLLRQSMRLALVLTSLQCGVVSRTKAPCCEEHCWAFAQEESAKPTRALAVLMATSWNTSPWCLVERQYSKVS